jgi:hypothetical protein
VIFSEFKERFLLASAYTAKNLGKLASDPLLAPSGIVEKNSVAQRKNIILPSAFIFYSAQDDIMVEH